MIKVNRIRCKAFRGIGPELSLRLNGRSLVLLGDNGTGKSSLIEAIEFAFTNNIQSLSSRGQRVSVQRHSTHVKWEANERLAEVELEVNGNGPITIQAGQDATQHSESVRNFLAGAGDGTFVLRRSSLLSFVEAKDKDRYESLRPFLSLDEFDNFENVLKAAKQKAEATNSVANTEMATLQQKIAGRFKISASQATEEMIIESVNSVLQSLSLATVSSLDELDQRGKEIQVELGTLGDTSILSAKLEARNSSAEFVAMLLSKEDLAELVSVSSKCLSEESKTTSVFYEQVLELGSRWITEESRNSCPLCEQSINANSIIASIKDRLNNNKELIQRRNAAEKIALETRTRITEILKKAQDTESKWLAGGQTLNDWPYKQAKEQHLRLQETIGKNSWIRNVTELQQAESNWQTFETKEIDKTVEPFLGSINNNGERLQQLLQAERDLLSSKELIAELREKQVKSTRLARVANRAKSLFESAVTSRKKASEEIFKTIEQTIATIYNAFHPDEPLGGFTLDVRDSGEGSVVLKSNFAERTGEDPRAYYSEAHQDTLGLAIFLAMRQKCAESNPKFNLLVLDDVLTSVDAPHRQRVATYILQKAATEGTQIIITTHSRQWYEWLLHIQATLGLRDKFVNKQILSWSLEEGPVIQDPEDDYEYLVRQLNNIDIHLLVPIAGRLLESILQQLRYSLQLAIPAKPDERYTLGDLFPKFKSDCGKKHKTLWNSIKELCDNLSNTWGIRNWDTHANEWAKDLSQEECKQFVEPVIELYKFIFCSSCRSFIHLGNIPAGIISCKKGCLCYQPNNQQENANISIT